jgi:tRNA-binding protein
MHDAAASQPTPPEPTPASQAEAAPPLSWAEFERVEMRIGQIVEVQPFPRAKKPAYRLRVWFGEAIGERWSSAQITTYAPDALIGRRVVATVNFAPKNIAGFQSQCLIMGAAREDGTIALLSVDEGAVIGGRVF